MTGLRVVNFALHSDLHSIGETLGMVTDVPPTGYN